MTNYEEIKQGLADYEAKVAKANAKFPERKEFKEIGRASCRERV